MTNEELMDDDSADRTLEDLDSEKYEQQREDDKFGNGFENN